MWCNGENCFDEMHILAYIYHWGRDEIRKIPRTERRRWVEKIIEQKKSENKAQQKAYDDAKSEADSKRSRR